ncbi:toll-like receptor 13 [Megalops cyprinoides]|uniref:toll-like receptor 13 n=1 Tax=Megalops cyprinoides TaxID=118141 RepID=UPI00186478F2|nr:toll-like receptor 13 [Megalops cyprinoides]
MTESLVRMRRGLFFILLLRFGIWDGSKSGVWGLIMRHCVTFEEDLFRDIAGTVPCHHMQGLGLYAECNNVTDFRSDLQEVSPAVRSLCLYHRATTLPAHSFSQFGVLEVLSVDGKIEKAQSGAFLGLDSLTHLHLLFSDSLCREVSLESGVFQGLHNLKELRMNGLRFANVPNTVFSPLVGVSKLQLYGDCIEDIGEVFCRLPPWMLHLETLILSYNHIATIQNQGCEAGSRSWPVPVLSGIKTLDLSDNPIKKIVPESLKVFQNLSSLEFGLKGQWVGGIWESGIGSTGEILLRGDPSDRLPLGFGDLCSLVSRLGVKSLLLAYSVIEELSVEVLKKCNNGLKRLLLGFSEIKALDLGFWVGVDRIEFLEMNRIKLNNASFCTHGKGKVWNITTLNLPQNLLKAIETNQFACMPLLEQLDLEQNLIESLASGAFHGLQRLRTLSLVGNHIKVLVRSDFEGLVALEVLLLHDNHIGNIEEGVFRKQMALQELTIGKLEYIYQLYLSVLFYGFPPKLRHLRIDAGYGTYISIGSASAPDAPFDLELNGDLLEFSECDSPVFRKVRELKVGNGQFTCQSVFMARYFSNVESLEYHAHPEKILTDYTGINKLTKLRRLKLTDLNFLNHTDPGLTFRNLTNLKTLLLLNCRLNFLTKSIFSDLKSLRLLRLYSDNPMTILEGALYPLQSLSVLVFDRLDFYCDCTNSWLLDWLEGSRRVLAVYLQRQLCVLHYQRLNFLSTMERLCQTDVHILCCMSTAVCVSLFLSAALGYRFARWPFLVLFFRVRGWVERRLGNKRRKRREGEEEEEEEWKFDAFVSYSSRDEAWVMDELAPRLEQEGEPTLRLCLHNRDFEVGKGIVDNIAESVYSSRRTVCVLSRRYLRSDWCALEMRVATHRLLSEQKHRLILIFLERISPFELSAYHRLAKLAQTRTYLDWPEQEAERLEFWERLRRNIADRDGKEERSREGGSVL